MAESGALVPDRSAENEKTAPAAVRSGTSRVDATADVRVNIHREDYASQHLGADNNGRPVDDKRQTVDHGRRQLPSHIDHTILSPNMEDVEGRKSQAEQGREPAGSPPLTERPPEQRNTTTVPAAPPPLPTEAILPPTILPAICQLLLVYIQRAALMAVISHPAEATTQQQPTQDGSQSTQHQTQQQETPCISGQGHENVDPPPLVAVKQLRVFDIPAPLLLQAAAHLMVVGAMLPKHFKAIQAELAPLAAPALPVAPLGATAMAKGGQGAASAANAAAAANTAAALRDTPVGDAPAAVAGCVALERPCRIDGQGGDGTADTRGEVVHGRPLCPAWTGRTADGGCGTAPGAENLKSGVIVRPGGPSVLAGARAVGRDQGTAPGDGGNGANALTGAVATMWVGQGAGPSPNRFGLGRRLFGAVAEQLPKSTELDSILPPLHGYSGVLYRMNGSLDVGAALWDGASLRDLGPYTTVADARQSVLMTTRLIAAAAAAAAVAPQSKPATAAVAGHGKLAARNAVPVGAGAAPVDEMVMEGGVSAGPALIGVAAETRAQAVAGGNSALDAGGLVSEHVQNSVEPEVAEAAEQLLLLRMSQEATVGQASGLDGLPVDRQPLPPEDQEQSIACQSQQGRQHQKHLNQQLDDTTCKREAMLQPQQHAPHKFQEHNPYLNPQQQHPMASAAAKTVAVPQAKATAAPALMASKGPLARAAASNVQYYFNNAAAATARTALAEAGPSGITSETVRRGGHHNATAAQTPGAMAPVTGSPWQQRSSVKAAQQPGGMAGTGTLRARSAMPEGSPRRRQQVDALVNATAVVPAATTACQTPLQPARSPGAGAGYDSRKQGEPLSMPSSDSRVMAVGGSGSANASERVNHPQLQHALNQQQQQQHLQQYRQQQMRPTPGDMERGAPVSIAAVATGTQATPGAGFVGTRKRPLPSEGPCSLGVRSPTAHSAVLVPGKPGLVGPNTVTVVGKAPLPGAVVMADAGPAVVGSALADQGTLAPADREGQLLLDLLSRSQSLPLDLSREALAVLINSTDGLAALLALLQQSKTQPPALAEDRGFADNDPPVSTAPVISPRSERTLLEEEECAAQNMQDWGSLLTAARRRNYGHPRAEHAHAPMPSRQQHQHQHQQKQHQQTTQQQQMLHGHGGPGTQRAARAYEILPAQRAMLVESSCGPGQSNSSSREYREDTMLTLSEDAREASCSAGGGNGGGGGLKRAAAARSQFDVKATKEGEPPAPHGTVLIPGSNVVADGAAEQQCSAHLPPSQRGGGGGDAGTGAAGRKQIPWSIASRSGGGGSGAPLRAGVRVPVEDVETEVAHGPQPGGAALPSSGLKLGGGGGVVLVQTLTGYTALKGAGNGHAAAAGATVALDFPPHEQRDIDRAGISGGEEGGRMTSSTTASMSAAAASQPLARGAVVLSGPSGDSGGVGGIASRYGRGFDDGVNSRVVRRHYASDHSPVIGSGSGNGAGALVEGGGPAYRQGGLELPPRLPQQHSVLPPATTTAVVSGYGARQASREQTGNVRGYSQYRGSVGDAIAAGGGVSPGTSGGATYSSLIADTAAVLYSAQQNRQISSSLPSYGASRVGIGACVEEHGRPEDYEPPPELSAEECEGAAIAVAGHGNGTAMRHVGDAVSDEANSGDGNGGGRFGVDAGDAAIGDMAPQAKRPRHGHAQVSREYAAVTNLMGLGLQEALALFHQRHGGAL